MVAVSDFSGLMSSAWALAKAEASAATVSLDRGIGGLGLQHVKAHRPRFRALGFHAVPGEGLIKCWSRVTANDIGADSQPVGIQKLISCPAVRISEAGRERRSGGTIERHPTFDFKI